MKRIARGGMALFTLKLTMVAIILLVQACQEHTIPEEAPLDRFSSFLTKERNTIIDGLRASDKNGFIDAVDENLTEPEAQILLVPTVNESKILLEHFGFTDQEFIEELGVVDETVRIYTALAVLEAERRFNNSNTYTASSLMFNQALADDSIGTCILEAIGVGALYDWAVGKATISRRALIRAVGKTLSRTIGWVGTALGVADFVWCMNRE